MQEIGIRQKLERKKKLENVGNEEKKQAIGKVRSQKM